MAEKINKNHRLSKIFKRAMALFIIVIINFNSYAAVVSSNDGSAFITKAEFDALVNDFNSRIEDYEKSIDAKIDGAIAEYLAGLATTSYEQMEPLISNYTDIRWMHGPYMYFTNRKFTAYANTSGNYNDTVKWQIINPENRRQTGGDGYFWFKDFLFDSFAMATVAFRMHPYDVPKGWGTGRGGSEGAASRGPSIYVCARKEDTGWAVYNEDGGIRGEQGHRPQVVIRPHTPTSSSISSNPLTYISAINSGRLLVNKTDSNAVSITANTLTSNEIANYTLNGLEVRNIGYDSDGRVFTGGDSENVNLDSKPLTNNNPAVLATMQANLWEGSGGTALKVGCGYEGFMGDNYNRSDDGLVEDNRWKTRSQYTYDNANFVYSMWGSDVSGNTNVAPPPKTEGEGTFLDLSNSGNVVTIPVRIKDFAFVLSNPYNGYSQRPDFVRYYSSVPSSQVGSMNFNIPLFYRVNWKDMLSGEFKYEGKSLSKSAGYPFVKKIPGVGKIRIKIKYQERSNTDTSVVSLTPDQKIKTYFKNKPFTDTTGTYLTGYTNINGEGIEVTLNGNEWTGGEITVLIPVEKDDEIWMRIDPLTEDGVYCQMTNLECVFITD